MQEREEEEEINGNVRKSKFIQIRANQKASKRLFTRIESNRFDLRVQIRAKSNQSIQ